MWHVSYTVQYDTWYETCLCNLCMHCDMHYMQRASCTMQGDMWHVMFCVTNPQYAAYTMQCDMYYMMCMYHILLNATCDVQDMYALWHTICSMWCACVTCNMQYDMWYVASKLPQAPQLTKCGRHSLITLRTHDIVFKIMKPPLLAE